MSDDKSSESDRSNVVFIGNKPVNSYVMASLTQLNKSANDSLVLKARGRAISRAVDVAEVLRNRFMEGKIDIVDIKLSTETLDSRNGRTSNVSAIEIELKAKG